MADKAEVSQRKIDTTDYKQRARVNLIAGAGIVILLVVGWYSARLIFDQEKLQSCISSGRKNCVDLKAPPREGVFVPTH